MNSSKNKLFFRNPKNQFIFALSFLFNLYFLNSCGTQQEEWKTKESSPHLSPAIVLGSLSGTPSTAGDNATFTINLQTPPGVDMVVALSSSDTTLGIVSHDNLTFSKDNYTTTQTVTVTGQCDNQSGGGTYSLTASAAQYYSSDNQSISATNKESAAFKVSSISGSVTETGDNATFTVHLCMAPTASFPFL